MTADNHSVSRCSTPFKRNDILEPIATIFLIKQPEGEPQITLVRDQCGLLFWLSMLFPAVGVPALVLSFVAFDSTRNLDTWLPATIILTLYFAIVARALLWRVNKKDFQFLRHAQILYSGLGFAWGAMIIVLADGSPLGQSLLLLGFAAGVVSTPIISVPFAIAFAFFVPNAALSVYAITFVVEETDALTSLSFVAFIIYISVGIIFNNVHFNGRSRAKTALNKEIQTVRTFLREYEEGSSDWLWCTDEAGRIRAASIQMANAFEKGPEEISGQILPQIVTVIKENYNAVDHGDQPRLEISFEECRAFHEVLVRYNGQKKSLLFRLTGRPVFDENGRFVEFRGIGRDVTREQKAKEEINFLAKHDNLTGLFNRGSFDQSVENLCQVKHPFALILVDVDNFKEINDAYGHHTGDLALKTIAHRMQGLIGEYDILSRIGGDEFAILLHEADRKSALSAAQRIIDSISCGFVIDGTTIRSSVSVGISVYPHDASTHDQLRVRADFALYKAKKERERVVLFSPSIEEEMKKLINEELELKRALENNEIFVVYQPIVNINSRKVVAIEALARWKHPERGIISPSEFIPLAERTRLIQALGELVLRLACHEAAQWSDQIQINVNLSSCQLRSSRFCDILSEVIKDTGLPPKRLALEITEAILLEKDSETVSQLHGIRELGVSLVLDDFGTGYSSLTYLHSLDIDGLKIDASFVQSLSQQRAQAVYHAIMRLAMDLNIYVVAEGVEAPEQLEWLDHNGLRFAQGYLLGKPSPIPAMACQYLSTQPS